jgi:Domain of unknown function (DUF4334)/GXWXG protein
MKTFSNAVDAGGTSTDEAWELFDSLDAVDIPFMIGSWKGATFPTGHVLDGVLEDYHWHGKRFDDPEHVYPLVFKTIGGNLISINPLWMMPVINSLDQLPVSTLKPFGNIFQRCLSLFSTTHSSARLCLTTYRGKASATMIYDVLPINDIFRKVDENTVLSVMDLKGMQQPYFFILQRDQAKR